MQFSQYNRYSAGLNLGCRPFLPQEASMWFMLRTKSRNTQVL